MKVISGCQTGADQAGLDAAMQLGLEVGGWVPKGRYNERGRISDKYPLQETQSHGYIQRTRRNVLSADATLILISGPLKGGSRRTRDIASQAGKPFLVVRLNKGYKPEEVVDWMSRYEIQTLNIAGSRESSSPGIYKKAKHFLVEVFTLIN